MRSLIEVRHASRKADTFRGIRTRAGKALVAVPWVLMWVSILCAAPAAAWDGFDGKSYDVHASADIDGHSVDGYESAYTGTFALKLDGVTVRDGSVSLEPKNPKDPKPLETADYRYSQHDLSPRHYDAHGDKGSSGFFHRLRQIHSDETVKVVFGLGEVKARLRF